MHNFAIDALILSYRARFDLNGGYARDYAESVFYSEHRLVIDALTAVNHYMTGYPLKFNCIGGKYDLYWNGTLIVRGYDVNQVMAYCKGMVNMHCMHMIGILK